MGSVYQSNIKFTLNLGDEKLSASVTLPLAERMIANMDKDNKMKQEQETRLYLMVLEFQVEKHFISTGLNRF